MSFRIIEEAFTIYQLKEILISSRKGLVFRLCDILKRYLYKDEKNQGSQAVI